MVEEPSKVFKDMGIVQNKAMNKRRRFLFSTFATLDFSDGPYTNYSLNLNPGFALSDFFEIYLSLAPAYLVNKRSIVAEVEKFDLANGEQARISSARPRYNYGVELLWAPLYGKDSLGISRIIRSDTFFKLGVSQIQYDITTGLGIKTGIGKTYFLGKSMGLRFCLNYGLIQTVINETKSFKSMMLIESGINFYL
jgi:outer membrane beta-barrel protein